MKLFDTLLGALLVAWFAYLGYLMSGLNSMALS